MMIDHRSWIESAGRPRMISCIAIGTDRRYQVPLYLTAAAVREVTFSALSNDDT